MTDKILSPLAVSESLWKKYSTRAPRYTSYPTAPHFHTDFDREATLERWRAAGRSAAPLSTYVHVPYCARRCLYCGCHTFVKSDRSLGTTYVDELLKELDLLAEVLGAARPVAQLAFGGGTPTFLKPEDMGRLVEGFNARFGFAQVAEKSIEVDPRSVNEEYLGALVDFGFNRFSFGIQDFDAEVLRKVGRPNNAEPVPAQVEYLRSRGVREINFDLIYGLPGQTPETMREAARRVGEYRPSRIAMFSYAHLPAMKPHQKALDKYGIPGDAEKIALWGTAFEAFIDLGYLPVGMDHFARPDDELYLALKAGRLHRNFMGYTVSRGADLAAVGVSSISQVGDTYAQDLKELEDWTRSLDEKKLPWERGYVMTPRESLRREVIIDLFCNFRLDYAAYERRHGIDFRRDFAAELERMSAFVPDGLVEVRDDALQVTDLGRFFIRNLCVVFDEFAAQDAGRVSYSKTV